MKEKIRKLIKVFFKWIFKDEIKDLYLAQSTYKQLSNRLINQLSNTDVNIDVHEYPHKYSPSWAVISIQGEKTDFIKFINLGNSDLKEIQKFLHHFDRSKIDASPSTTMFLKFDR